jgi:hypothetical protein
MDIENCDLDSSTHIRVFKSRKMRHGKVCITHGEVKKKHALCLETWGGVSIFETITSNDVGGSELDS